MTSNKTWIITIIALLDAHGYHWIHPLPGRPAAAAFERALQSAKDALKISSPLEARLRGFLCFFWKEIEGVDSKLEMFRRYLVTPLKGLLNTRDFRVLTDSLLDWSKDILYIEILVLFLNREVSCTFCCSKLCHSCGGEHAPGTKKSTCFNGQHHLCMGQFYRSCSQSEYFSMNGNLLK